MKQRHWRCCLRESLFTAVLGTVGLLVYAPALRTVQYMLNSLFFHTLSDFKDTDWEQFLSPLFAYSGIPVNIENQLPVGKYAVYGVVLAVLLAVLWAEEPAQPDRKAAARHTAITPV